MVISRRTFRAHPDRVYDALVDAERYPQWLVGAKVVRVLDDEWPLPGASFVHQVGAGPIDVDDVTTSTGAVPGRSLDLHVRARPLLEADVHFELREVRRGCEVTMDETPTGRFAILKPVLAPFVRLRNDRSLARLERLVGEHVRADHGWAVTVLEANAEPGGAVRTAEVTAPGFRNDLFSAFYPMTAASPVMTELDLGAQGLSWTHAPAVLAHPQRNAPAAMLYRDVERTADRLALDHRADAEAYAALTDEWRRVGADVMASLLRPFPPVRPALRLVRRAGVRELGVLARRAVMPVRRFVDEEFGGVAAPLLYAGNALHADLTPESAGSALFGWLLVSVGQQCGFPVPVGGAGAITDALVARLEQRNGTVQCDARVVEVVVRAGRAVGVRTADGDHVAARHAVIADVDATVLYRDLVGEHHLPDRLVAGLGRIERSSATFKVDWALNRPIPWSDPDVADAGTVHIADDMAELARTSAQLATRTVPDRPFVLLGQMTTADPTRSPPGTASVWAYTHVPQHIITDAGGDGITGRWHAPEVDRFVERIERRIEALAPGFGSSILARNVMAPPDMERANANLVGGDTSGGTTQLYQQLVFRPTLGFARAETPVRGLYLGSASAHPGGAVHGACGANAARAALAHRRVSAILRR